MSYDSKLNTIFLNEDSDFKMDSGIFFIHTLRKITLLEKSLPTQIINDWRVIERWLGCANREISKQDEESIRKAWRAYYALGLAPSFKLQDSFDSFAKQYKIEGHSNKGEKPPAEIMDVFDRLLATDDELAAKRKHDMGEEQERLKQAFKGLREKGPIRQRLTTLSKNTRIYIAASAVWFIWVVFRTSGQYELLGIFLDDWDKDMILVNVLLPISLIFVGNKIFKWIISATK